MQRPVSSQARHRPMPFATHRVPTAAAARRTTRNLLLLSPHPGGAFAGADGTTQHARCGYFVA